MAEGLPRRRLLLYDDSRLQSGLGVPVGSYSEKVQPLVVVQIQILDFSFQRFLPWSVLGLFAASEFGGAGA